MFCVINAVDHLFMQPRKKLASIQVNCVGACTPPIKCLSKENVNTHSRVEEREWEKIPHIVKRVMVINVFKKHSKPYMYMSNCSEFVGIITPHLV